MELIQYGIMNSHWFNRHIVIYTFILSFSIWKGPFFWRSLRKGFNLINPIFFFFFFFCFFHIPRLLWLMRIKWEFWDWLNRRKIKNGLLVLKVGSMSRFQVREEKIWGVTNFVKKLGFLDLNLSLCRNDNDDIELILDEKRKDWCCIDERKLF